METTEEDIGGALQTLLSTKVSVLSYSSRRGQMGLYHEQNMHRYKKKEEFVRKGR